MFKATIITQVLQSSIKALSALVDESVFVIAPDGLSSVAVDAANASLASITIPSTEFKHFDATEAELGIDLQRFTEIIGMANKDGDIELELNEDTHKLGVRMGDLSYTMALLDPSTLRKTPTVPNLDLPAMITLSAATFKRIIKAASMVSDHMSMGVQGDTFFMEATGDSDNVRLDMSGSELIDLKPADVSSMYSLDYLSDVSKGIGGAAEVVINLGRDLPILIIFESSTDCPVTYVLAPRVESD